MEQINKPSKQRNQGEQHGRKRMFSMIKDLPFKEKNS